MITFVWGQIGRRLVGVVLGLLVTAIAGCGGSSSLEAVPGKFRFGGKLVAQSITVGATHVYAVSAEADSLDRVLAPLDADGRFVLDLPLGRSYVIGVLDASRTGAAMVRGYLEFDGVRALPIEAEGVFDLGAISQSDGSRWSSELAGTGGLLATLGVSTPTLVDALAAQDGLALRYLSADVDGNAILDVNESGKSFLANADVFYEARSSGTVIATFDDIRNGTIPTFSSFALDTTKAAPLVASFGYLTSNTETSVTFRYIDAEGTVPSIEPNGAPSLVSDTDGTFPAGAFSGSSAYQAVELGLLPASEFPRGEIRVNFTASSTALTFFPMLPQLAADLSQGYLHAFAVIGFTESGGGACATAPCPFTQLQFAWKIATSSGIRDATAADMRVLVSSRGAKYKFEVGGADTVDITIPSNATQGIIAWDPMNANLGNVSGTTFSALTRTQLCGNRVEHYDRFGLKYVYRIAPALLATGCTN